jgi:hypothetical protein
MNPLGDNGLMVLGIGHVSVVAITLFIRNEKGATPKDRPKHRF